MQHPGRGDLDKNIDSYRLIVHSNLVAKDHLVVTQTCIIVLRDVLREELVLFTRLELAEVELGYLRGIFCSKVTLSWWLLLLSFLARYNFFRSFFASLGRHSCRFQFLGNL